MRYSQSLIATRRDAPADAEVISHQLMVRAGMVQKVASGIYNYLPLGFRVIRKVEQIIREEMLAAGAVELLMPMVQPASLWEETERWQAYGKELLRLQDRKDNDFCLGPTHEEVITDIARRELKSYRQLPVNYYQIQTKFRDENRPRYGVMRAREYNMKDAYSFHIDQASLEKTYTRMADAYSRIFTRLGLHFRPVDADSGQIGGARSQEFHVLADSGEDAIAYCEASGFAANVELAPALAPTTQRRPATATLAAVPTPSIRSIDEVAQFLSAEPAQCLKTLIVEGEKDHLIALVLRGDHQLNIIKAEKLPGVAAPLQMASAERIEATIGCPPGFVGPVGLTIPVFADHSAVHTADFICGANQVDQHLTGVNWDRDLDEPEAVDIRNVTAGDLTTDGGILSIARGVEVGHIFQLGDKYSHSMNARVLDHHGREVSMLMGCYGIGVTRIVAAAIEQNHDQHGIVWPEPMSPFAVTILTLNPKKTPEVNQAAEALLKDLEAANLTVLFDDRDARPGVKFADADLLGIPHRVVIGARGLRDGAIEYRHRKTGEETRLAINDAADFLQERVARD